MSEEKTVRRILHFKFTMPSAEGAQLLKMLKNSAPYATIFGEVNVRFLQNADDRAKILQIVEYNAPETIEANRQSLASDAAGAGLSAGLALDGAERGDGRVSGDRGVAAASPATSRLAPQ